MKSRIPWLVVVLSGVMLASTMPAFAKIIPMRPASRGAVDSACARAGGSAYGIHDDTGSYGCASRRGQVECTPDGGCSGYVSDLAPMTGNSLDAILGVRLNGRAIKIGPTEKRISRQVQN
jgi:hypothetical protein